MTRKNIQPAVSPSAVSKSGRWPRQYAGYRDSGRRGATKGKTLRDFRKVVA